MTTPEFLCQKCPWIGDDVGPFSEDATGSDDRPIIKFHRDAGHNVIEYSEDIFDHLNSLVDGVKVVDKPISPESIKNYNDTIYEIQKENEIYSNWNKKNKKSVVTPNEVTDYVLSKEKFFAINDKNRELLRYQNGVYVIDNSTIDKIMESDFPNESRSSFRHEVLEKIKIRTLTDREEIDADDNIKNLLNGLFDLDQGIKLDHTPEYKSRIQWNIKYDENAKCPKFFRFLNTVILDNRERYTALEMMALCFWSKNKLVKSFFLLGDGSNGKSVLRSILVEMAGERHTSKLTLDDYEDKYAPADLDGKIINIPDEINDKKISTTDKWKSATSHNSIRAQRKFGQPFDFTPYVQNIFPCNNPPQIDDKSDGTYRRIVPIHFDQRFATNLTDEEMAQGVKPVDEKFTDSLLEEEEISGIFNVLVTVLRHLKKRGRLAFELSIEEVRKEWETISDPYVDFISTELDVDNEGIDLKTNFYRKYFEFSKKKGYRIDGINTFYAKFMEKGAIETRNRITPKGSQQHCFTGFWYKNTPKVTTSKNQATL